MTLFAAVLPKGRRCITAPGGSPIAMAFLRSLGSQHHNDVGVVAWGTATLVTAFARGARMRTAAEYRAEAAGYRAEAERYVREADKDITSARRAHLLQMAQTCLRMADEAELLAGEDRMNGDD